MDYINLKFFRSAYPIPWDIREAILADYQLEICSIYIDDIIVFGKSQDEAIENFRKKLDSLKHTGLT